MSKKYKYSDKILPTKGGSYSDSGRTRTMTCFYKDHDDESGSMKVNLETGKFKCWGAACQKRGNYDDYLRATGRKRQMKKRTTRSSSRKAPALDVDKAWPKIIEYHNALIEDEEGLNYFVSKRGLTREVIVEYKLGLVTEGSYKGWYSVPCLYGGELFGWKVYNPNADGKDKMRHFTAFGASEVSLYGASMANAEVVIICEGEFDCLCALSRGYTAVTGTGGAGTWKSAWCKEFRGKDVAVIYDQDRPDAKGKIAGREGAIAVCRQLKSDARTLRMVELPFEESDLKDVTDFFVVDGRTSDDLDSLILDTRPMAPPQLKMNQMTMTRSQRACIGLWGQSISEGEYGSRGRSAPHTVRHLKSLARCGSYATMTTPTCAVFVLPSSSILQDY